MYNESLIAENTIYLSAIIQYETFMFKMTMGLNLVIKHYEILPKFR